MASRWLLSPIAAIVRLFSRTLAPEQVIGVSIFWTANDHPILLMRMFADGGINRMGSGSLDNQDKELFIGVADPKHFEQLRAHITTDLLKWLGYRKDSVPRGRACVLKIGFYLRQGRGRLIVLKYGEDSLSPPSEVSRFVSAASEITKQWHQEFKIGTQKMPMQTGEDSVQAGK